MRPLLFGSVQQFQMGPIPMFECSRLDRLVCLAGRRLRLSHAIATIIVTLLVGSAAAADSPGAGTTLIEYGAGTLAVPFKAINTAFEKSHAGIHVQAQFGGSVKMAKQITELQQPADVLAVADYSVIPRQLYGKEGGKGYATWYIGFAGNAITFVYTGQSKGASKINAANWYQVLAEPGVEIGRSNPDTDPSGYQTLQLLELAEGYYHQPGLAQAILKNAPERNMRNTETELVGALESGQIDYLAIYRSDALQHHFQYLPMPEQIDLSNAARAEDYGKVSMHTRNGDLQGRPIIYAVTIPLNAPHPQQALQFVQFLLSAEGQKVMRENGFAVPEHPIADGFDQLPAELKRTAKPWPTQP
jgi:molybdate/tungstate transport system substrate-binding protein